MTVRPILRWPDPRLSQRCAPVAEGAALETLIADLFDTMYAAPGRGLAAPQIGAMLRLFVMDCTWKDGTPSPEVCINPQIVEHGEETIVGVEGCLSIPGVAPGIHRHARVRMLWTDARGAQRDEWLDGFAARCVQHEIDHLDGKVFFDRMTDEARDRALAAYDAARGA